VKILFIGLYTAISSLLTRMRREDGQTMAEYGILIGVIAIVVVAAAVFLGGSITSLFNTTGSHL
jgi:Flp pilus assembly pilin Flp